LAPPVAATSVAAIDGVLAGVLVGFLLQITTSSSLSAVGVASAVVAIAVVTGLMLDQERAFVDRGRRQRTSETREPTSPHGRGKAEPSLGECQERALRSG